MEELIWLGKIIFFKFKNLSQIMYINKKILIKDVIDPNDEMKFHNKNESGKSEYRRGIPDSPKKCCGKKVKFTPKNLIKNWIFNNKLFI